MFCRVQIYCQAGVFPKRGVATSSRTRATSGLTSSPFTPRRRVLTPTGNSPLGTPSSPVPGGYLIGDRASSRNWPGSKLPLVAFHGSVRSTFASSQSPLMFTSAKGESSRRSLARPSPQRATARRGPHKPALLGFGLFSHVQIYCQAGVFPKRGVAPFWSVGGGCREGKSKSPPCRFFGFLNRFFALKEMV